MPILYPKASFTAWKTRIGVWSKGTGVHGAKQVSVVLNVAFDNDENILREALETFRNDELSDDPKFCKDHKSLTLFIDALEKVLPSESQGHKQARQEKFMKFVRKSSESFYNCIKRFKDELVILQREGADVASNDKMLVSILYGGLGLTHLESQTIRSKIDISNCKLIAFLNVTEDILLPDAHAALAVENALFADVPAADDYDTYSWDNAYQTWDEDPIIYEDDDFGFWMFSKGSKNKSFSNNKGGYFSFSKNKGGYKGSGKTDNKGSKNSKSSSSKGKGKNSPAYSGRVYLYKNDEWKTGYFVEQEDSVVDNETNNFLDEE